MILLTNNCTQGSHQLGGGDKCLLSIATNVYCITIFPSKTTIVGPPSFQSSITPGDLFKTMCFYYYYPKKLTDHPGRMFYLIFKAWSPLYILIRIYLTTQKLRFSLKLYFLSNRRESINYNY